jgi:hypothetical protein
VWIKTAKGQPTKAQKIGMSTKGRDVLQPFLERVMDWLIENYDPPHATVDLEAFENGRDTIYPTGESDNYIEYLNACGLLIKPK